MEVFSTRAAVTDGTEVTETGTYPTYFGEFCHAWDTDPDYANQPNVSSLTGTIQTLTRWCFVNSTNCRKNASAIRGLEKRNRLDKIK